MDNGQYSAIDLFCGAGGLSVGLEWVGFDVLWAVEQDAKAATTYQHNNPDVDLTVDDIREVEFPDLGLEESLSLVAGGPPCPTFSKVGRAKLNSLDDRGPETDERHQLWQEFLRAIDHYRPEAFLMENVPEMASAENDAGRKVLPIILNSMRSLDYRVSYAVVDAANYGVPQHRERLFIVGNRGDLPNPEFESWATHREPDTEREKRAKPLSSTPTEPEQETLTEYASGEENGDNKDTQSLNRRQPWVTVASAILDLPPLSPGGNSVDHPEHAHPPTAADSYYIPAMTEYQQWARTLPEGTNWEEATLHNHEARYHNMTDLSIYKLLGEGTGWTIREFGQELQPYRSDVFQDSYTKQAPDEPASTVPAHIHKDGHMHIHPSEARSLTVREAARLQSFQDSYHFPVSRTAAYRQVGNAVPPLFAKRIAEAISDTVLGSN